MKTVSLLLAVLFTGQASSAIIYQGTLSKNTHKIEAKISVKNENAIVQIKKVKFGMYGGLAKMNEASPMVDGLEYDVVTKEILYNDTVCGTLVTKKAYDRSGAYRVNRFRDNGSCKVSVEVLKQEKVFRVHLD